MPHESLIGFTISTRSKNSVSCASKISFPSSSVSLHDTKASKVSERANLHDFYSIMHFYPSLTLKDTRTMLRRNLKKIRIM
jgi:hypothetical protein